MLKFIFVIFSLFLVACTEPENVKVGSDLDEYGCKASAGYQWCGKTQQCERPWELAKEHKFDNSEAQFTAFCAAE